MANGIPVLASERGALPETLGDSGFVFTISDRYTQGGLAIPTPHEVAPWVATIERLWDEPQFEARHSALARAESKRWLPDRLTQCYHHVFEDVVEECKIRQRSRCQT